jgi:hypothetical protein
LTLPPFFSLLVFQFSEEIKMAYELSNPVRRLGPQGAGKAVWFYNDGDTLATIDGADYFLLDVDKLKVGDIIFAVGNAVPGTTVVLTRTATAIDVANFGGQATIDSD